MLTRRWMLFLLALLTFVLSLGRRRALAMLFAGPKRKEEPHRPANPFHRNGRNLVGIAGGGGVEADVRQALDLIGGLGPLDLAGKTVLVKPNVVSGKPPPSTTNPEVVRVVVKLLYEAGARKVYVGDMSAMVTLVTSSTLRLMEKTGLRRAAEEAGAEVIGFEDHDWIEVAVPEARYLDKVLVTEWLYRVDAVVNVPVIKTHRSASYSICLKNFIGCTHLRQRPYLIDSDHWEELVAEFNLAYRPQLHIVDGTVSMIEGGPWDGPSSRTGLIIASGDPVAADALGLGIIKAHGRWEMVTAKEIWDQKQLHRALELGLGGPREKIRLLSRGDGAEFTRLLDAARRFSGL